MRLSFIFCFIIGVSVGFYAEEFYPSLKNLKNFYFKKNVETKVDNDDLIRANELWAKGDKDGAKVLYLKAACAGEPDAHFTLGYKYVTSDQEKIYYFTEAAKKGHEKALEYALNYLFFKADSLFVDPAKTLELYHEAKRANPDLKIQDEEKYVEVLKMAAEAGNFDANAFIEKYKIPQHNKTNKPDYYVWKLAEEASVKGIFGEPDPKLLLQLISRGGISLDESFCAVKKVYNDWKNGIVERFDICNSQCINSNTGIQFCNERTKQDQ